MMTTVDEAARLYLRSRHAIGIGSSTINHERYRLRRLVERCGHRQVVELRPHDAEAYLGHWAGRAPGTRRLALTTLRNFVGWAQIRWPLPDICAGMRVRTPRTLPRPLTVDQVGRLLAVLPDARARAIVIPMHEWGLRVSEVSRLRIDDWDRCAELVMVTGKGGKQRLLPVTDPVRAAWSTYLASPDAVDAAGLPLIQSRRDPGQGIGPHQVSRMVRGWLVDAGVKRAAGDGVTPHALRHTAATATLDASGDLRTVQELLGHANLASTSIYLGWAGVGRLRAALEARRA